MGRRVACACMVIGELLMEINERRPKEDGARPADAVGRLENPGLRVDIGSIRVAGAKVQIVRKSAARGGPVGA